MGETRARAGLIYGLLAYGCWGLMPLYFAAVAEVSAWEILAHRIVWCVGLLAVVLSLAGRWTDFFSVLRNSTLLGMLSLSALLVAANWLIYIYGVTTRQIVMTSLGYFINPLFSVLLGLIFFRERLRPGQWFAIALAATGIAYLLIFVPSFPWIALSLTVSFGFYGLVRKITPVDGLVGLAVETLLLLPFAAGYLLWLTTSGRLQFGSGGLRLDVLLALSGLVTAVPLLCFGQAARRLPLSTLGFLQYLAPTCQFLLAVLLFHEEFGVQQRISYGLVWSALIVFTIESLHQARSVRLVESTS